MTDASHWDDAAARRAEIRCTRCNIVGDRVTGFDYDARLCLDVVACDARCKVSGEYRTVAQARIEEELRGTISPASLEASKEALDLGREFKLLYDHITLEELTWFGWYEIPRGETVARIVAPFADGGTHERTFRFDGTTGMVAIELVHATSYLRQLDAEGDLFDATFPLLPRPARWWRRAWFKLRRRR